MLTLKNFARKLSIALDVVAVIIIFIFLAPVILQYFRYGGWHIGSMNFPLLIVAVFFLYIYIFTHPKIKEQFKQP